jgi:hypothetical protein
MGSAKTNDMRKIYTIFIILILTTIVFGQRELLSNAQVVEMTKAGLAQSVIIKKIRDSEGRYDTSVTALVELKRSGVGDDVINVLLESKPAPPSETGSTINPQVTPTRAAPVFSGPREALTSAKTIAFTKSSIQPSIQALEKELMKRKEWPSLNLAIDRKWDKADLYVDIGFVHMSVITHRYVFTVYDRRSGTVIAAGETTSWGSLAENLARNIAKSLIKVRNG